MKEKIAERKQQFEETQAKRAQLLQEAAQLEALMIKLQGAIEQLEELDAEEGEATDED